MLEGARVAGDRLALSYLERASSRLRLSDLDGGDLREVELPTLGSLFGTGAEWDGHELFFGFSSYTVPPSVYRVDLAHRRADAVAAGRGGRGSRPVRGPPGVGAVEGRHAGEHVPGASAGTRARRREPGVSHRLRRLQHQHDAGVLPLDAAVAGAGRRRRHSQHPGRRRVRRGVAPGRNAGPEAEQLRRFHRGGRVADPRAVHQAGAAGGGGRIERRPAHGCGAHPAARSCFARS